MNFPIYHIDERTLLSKIASNDEVAFGELFDRYHHMLGTFIYRLTKSQELTDEVVQDVFLKIWNTRDKLKNISNFKSYLFTVSKNHALNCLKKIASESVITTSLEQSCAEEYIAHSEDWQENDLYELLDEAIDKLPPQQKKVYLMSKHERLKYNEIALKLNISRETVKKYLQLSSKAIANCVKSEISTKAAMIILYFL